MRIISVILQCQRFYIHTLYNFYLFIFKFNNITRHDFFAAHITTFTVDFHKSFLNNNLGIYAG